MTEEELNEIKSHLTDHTQNWDVRLAQKDRLRLLAEVDHLRKKLQDITGVAPDPGGGEWVNGAYYDCKPCFECGETDQTHDFKCSKHPSNVVILPDPVDAMVACHQYSTPNPITENAVTGNTLRCDYRGALAECHSLYCPVHGVERDR